MRLRTAVIGLGRWWETRHRPALRSLVDRFEVRAVSSSVGLLAEQAANDFRCRAVDGFHAIACRPDIDAVLILDRQWYSPLPIIAASEHGKAVYCSTTLELPGDQALEVKRRVDASGVAFMAELPRRQAPATQRLKELIATRLGQPKLIFCHQRAMTRKAGTPPTDGVTTLLEQVDWCRYVMGREVAGVTAISHEGGKGEEDHFQLSLDFRDGPETTCGKAHVAHISYGTHVRPEWPEAASFRPPADLQVCCEHGVAFVDLPATVTWFDAAGRHLESLEHDRPVGEQLLNLFHRSVTSLVRRTSGLADACLALRIVAAARESAETCQRQLISVE
ncbi:MAG: Gfo/Idh/MocA family oxidoreductase [Planctomycetales bacterium]|nr:Gfo/Idh/MocA family oxidoreductase [Planctomycetales bacterium]